MARTICKNQMPVKLIVLLAFTLLLPLAHAGVLANGGIAPVSPLVPPPSGPLVAATSGTITTTTFSATYVQHVLADANNTWCANCLDFMYKFTNFTGTDDLGRFTMSNFAGFSAFVGTMPFGVLDPISVDRNLTGTTIGFNYLNLAITPGQTTPWLVIETNARNFTNGLVSAQGAGAGEGFAFAPVPESGSLVLMGGGLLALGGFLRKSRLVK